MKTNQEQLNWEIQAYGMSKAELNAMVKEQSFGNPLMFAAGLLSDAQELIGAERNEFTNGWVGSVTANQARQFINCAKAIIFEIMDNERASRPNDVTGQSLQEVA